MGHVYGSRMGYHENILLKTNGGQEGGGRGRDRTLNFVACGA